ncbi:MAG: hypothetical protein J0H85_16595 [Sediminibacterium magnilacihabitans]|jgi:hypothetical protein|nr:hypothetical protein [Sediminibacterium magnilacihabitans]PQV57314.1 hypothetical protein CLV53_12818 [Sediminibacterium magnilacihabitans]
MRYLFSCLLFLALPFATLKAQNYPDLSGTWYQNGNSNYPAYIIQNGQNLTFIFSNTTSTVTFTSVNQVYANTWKAAANISADGNTLTWSDQTWTRAVINYPNIAGTWYVNGSPVTITQNGKMLEFTMAGGKSKGYFYSTQGIYATEWNTYATYDAGTQSLKWNNQTWTIAGGATVSGSNTGTAGTTKICRRELSAFFYAMTALGTTWARPIYEPGAMSARTIADLRGALSLVVPTLNLFPCIVFDRNRITNLSNSLGSITGTQASQESHQIIIDLQVAVRNAGITCDRGLNLEMLFIGGIHLGAAQAHASSRICQPVPMPANIASTISAHLTTAHDALATLLPCMPDLQLGAFSTVPLGSMNSVEPHTFIVGIITETLWAVTLTDCCCTCTGNASVNPGTTCDQECHKWCREHGKSGGKFNGICLLGVMSGGTQPDCQCW